jgi:hypothetical protein
MDLFLSAVLAGKKLTLSPTSLKNLKAKPLEQQMQLSDNDFYSYLATVLWSESDESTPQGGEPLDKNYDQDDFDAEGLKKQREQCQQFVDKNKEIIEKLIENGHEMSTIMHDFWLTRNGHGAGFWDGDYPEPVGEVLTDSARTFGDVAVYVGDDNTLYFSP